MSRLSRSPALIALAAATLAACASTPPPPPPPASGSGSVGALRDWRGIVTAADRDRYSRRDAGVATEDGPSALPGFLTRSTAPAPAAAPEAVEAAAEAPAPKRRAPRRKVEAPAAD